MDNDKCYKCNFFLGRLPPKCEAAITTLIAEILSEGLSSVQIKVFANFMVAIGGSMQYIALQKDLNAEFEKQCLDDQDKAKTSLTENNK